MNKLFAWLRVEPKRSRLLLFFAIILLCQLLYSWITVNILEGIGIQLNKSNDALVLFVKQEPLFFMGIFLPICAMIEEFFFRLPLIFLCGKQPKMILLGAIILSMIFGYAHGGWQQIPLQGFCGMILCLVFLKCGGLHEKPGKAFLSSSFVHVAFNWSLFTLAMLDLTHA